MSEIQDILKESLEKERAELQQIEEAEASALAIETEEYKEMALTRGWGRLKDELTERVSSLTKRLLMEKDEKTIYRIQGEALGLASILETVSIKIDDIKGDQENG